MGEAIPSHVMAGPDPAKGRSRPSLSSGCLLLFLLYSNEVMAGATGTGVVIDRRGDVLTAAHVVQKCRSLTVRIPMQPPYAADILARDVQNDLALLHLKSVPRDPAVVLSASPPHVGESVVVIGYPLSGLLSSEPITTTGVLSSASGVGDDVRYYQLTAPVQPGNSGGPLLDSSGNLIGLITAKLDFRVAGLTGAIPENVNFAVKSEMIKLFMNSHGFSYQESASNKEQKVSSISEAARHFTAQIRCETSPVVTDRKIVRKDDRSTKASREQDELKGFKPEWLKRN